MDRNRANSKSGNAMRLGLKILAGVLAACLIALLALMMTFTSAKLKVVPVDVGELPEALPPAGMSISALPTGTYESSAALAFLGGEWKETRQFTTTALFIHHPKGNLLIDAGMGKNVDEHLQIMPFMMRIATKYKKAGPVVSQLAAAGMEPEDISAVIPTHTHWDHISGLDDLKNVPVMVNARGKAWIDSRADGTEVINSFHDVRYELYSFDSGAYLGFDRSHDVWGDGSVVIVPAPGHTPDSVVVFVNLPSGIRYAMVGDLVFQMDGLNLPAEKPWLLRRLIGEDDDEVHAVISKILSIRAKYPQIQPVPSHDASAFRSIPVFPASIR